MPFFRRSEAVDLPTAMSGIELGDRLLVVGCSDPMPIARLARRVGLTGRAGAVDESSQRVAAAGRTAEREGALIETAVAPPAVLPTSRRRSMWSCFATWLPLESSSGRESQPKQDVS